MYLWQKGHKDADNTERDAAASSVAPHRTGKSRRWLFRVTRSWNHSTQNWLFP